jgi:Ca2+-binding EF-hand superfamily protein
MADFLSEEQIEDLKQAFGMFDPESTGMISLRDMPTLLRWL